MLRQLMVLVMAALVTGAAAAKVQPNVLWILTDDQRYDSIRAFNRMLHGREMSALGYVESPNVDKLAEMGTTYVNTYCHAQGCAPSRASMHYGRYPFRSGIYEFEYHNNNAAHCRPTLPEQMARLGYQTMHVGKLGVRLRTVKNGRVQKYQIYQTDIDFKMMQHEGFTGWTKGEVDEINGIKLGHPVQCDWFFSPGGQVEYSGSGLNDLAGFEGYSQRIDEKYDLLRMYNSKRPKGYGRGEIIGGVCSQPAGKTRDGRYTTEMIRYLEHPQERLTVGSQTYVGVDPNRPVFIHLGYDFPHTPVLPPESYRKRFEAYRYRVPEFDRAELDEMPEQLKKLVTINESDHYTAAEKQQMIRDYYAFCAYGDQLVGEAVEEFLRYCKRWGRPWLIVYVCGDHGWKLNEHGAISKFSPWDVDAHNPIIVASSDQTAFKAGKVVRDLTEFVDIAPTILAAGGADLGAADYDYLDGYDLGQVARGEVAKRDYILCESHAVTGPRATIRTKDYMFSLKSRPDKNRGKDMQWALKASYEALEPVLYDLREDPAERHNLAFDQAYEGIAQRMKKKLLDIVLGDNRVEVNWGKKGDGVEIFRSNFAEGADDKQLKGLSKGKL